MKNLIFSICIMGICILPPIFNAPHTQLIILSLLASFLLNIKKGNAFLTAFTIGSLSWFFYCSYLDVNTTLNEKIGQIFKGITVVHLKEIAAVIAGVSCGLGSYAGGFMRAIFQEMRNK